jgi:hypothetical protein
MSVGLPSWRELIDRIGQELGLDPDAVLGPDTSYHTLAEYYRVVKGSIGPLRSWLDRNWNVGEEQVRNSRLHEIIVELDFPAIYTTNYDRNLEVAFAAHGRDYVKVSNARDVSRVRSGVTQIVKFHGDFDEDESLVIAETDYLDRLAFGSPLDIKFRADALGHTLLFVGYSMSDLNIRLLLHNLWQTWVKSGYGKDRPPSFVFMAKPNPVQEAVLGQWGITALTGEGDDPACALLEFMEGLYRQVRDPAASK